MTVHQLSVEQIVAQPRAEVFGFFSRPENLGRITPPAMRFAMVSTDRKTDAGEQAGEPGRQRALGDVRDSDRERGTRPERPKGVRRSGASAADLAQIDAAIGAPDEKPGGERPDGVAHRRESAKREPGRRHVHRSEYVIALGAGGWWTIFAPVLMTYLLVRVSGVALLERGLALRRTGYAEYIRDVPSFIPRPPR